MKSFDYWRRRFQQNDLLDFSCSEEGNLWLKLRSIDRKDLVTDFCKRLNIPVASKVTENLWQLLNNDNNAKECLASFMRDCQSLENQRIDETFELIRSNLYKLEHFHWGGGFRNSLDKAIVTRFVKTTEIIPYEKLNQICEGEILEMTRGYLVNSWYNYWSTVLLENIFRRNPHVMPAYGKIKNVDFFVKDFPFDLKVTYIPKEYTDTIQHKLGIVKPLTRLKQYAKNANIAYDRNADDDTIQHELLERIKDEASDLGLDLLSSLKQDYGRIVDYVIEHKRELIQWLYENQGDMRFGAENRLFLIMVDKDNPHEAWKLKRNTDKITPAIQKWVEEFEPSEKNSLQITFSYNSESYKTFADAIFICK